MAVLRVLIFSLAVLILPVPNSVSRADKPHSNLLYRANGNLYLFDATARESYFVTGGFEGLWSFDGKQLVVTEKDGLVIINSDGTNRRHIEKARTVLSWL